MRKNVEKKVWIDLWFVPGIPTDAAFASVGLPLPGEASAVAFVVVVVRRSVKAVPGLSSVLDFTLGFSF